MRQLTNLEKAQADLRRVNNIFWTGEETLKDHMIRIHCAEMKVKFWEIQDENRKD